ncbi:hypothetical protein J6590_032403, partial [Homalodisca vitripennis]
MRKPLRKDESAGIAEAPSVSRLHHTDRRDRHVTCGVREHVCGAPSGYKLSPR